MPNFSGAELFKSAYLPGDLLPAGQKEIVVSGRSNVGKSSLVNRLVGRKSLARVSSSPGKTASVNYYRCGGFFLVDLPGYGYAGVSRQTKLQWAELVERYFVAGPVIALLVQLVDVRTGLSGYDRDMLAFVKERGLSCLVVLTKCDKLGKTALAEQTQKLGEEISALADVPVLAVSARTGYGMDALRAAVLKAAGEA